MTELDLTSFGIVVTITTATTTALTYVIVSKAKASLCEDIKKYRAFAAEEFNKIKVRLGIIENEIQ